MEANRLLQINGKQLVVDGNSFHESKEFQDEANFWGGQWVIVRQFDNITVKRNLQHTYKNYKSWNHSLNTRDSWRRKTKLNLPKKLLKAFTYPNWKRWT